MRDLYRVHLFYIRISNTKPAPYILMTKGIANRSPFFLEMNSNLGVRQGFVRKSHVALALVRVLAPVHVVSIHEICMLLEASHSMSIKNLPYYPLLYLSIPSLSSPSAREFVCSVAKLPLLN